MNKRNFLFALLLICEFPAWASSDLNSMRKSFSQLEDEAWAFSGRPALFRWRDSSYIATIFAGENTELNNFETRQVGLHARIPLQDFVYGFSISRINVTDSRSTEMMGHSPYRQAGRPSRMSIENSFGLPLFEGWSSRYFTPIDTLQFLLLPSMCLRSHFYKDSFAGTESKDMIQRLLNSKMDPKEWSQVQDSAPQAMLVDDRKWDLLLAIDFLVFSKSGFTSIFGFQFGYPIGSTQKERVSRQLDLRIGMGHAL